jgi:hypothetical protein
LKSKLKKKKRNIISLKKKYKDEKIISSRLEIELARTKKAKNDFNLKLTACQEKFREWESYGAMLRDVNVGDL